MLNTYFSLFRHSITKSDGALSLSNYVNEEDGCRWYSSAQVVAIQPKKTCVLAGGEVYF